MTSFQNQIINDSQQITINNKIYLTYPYNKHSHNNTIIFKGQKYYYFATKLSK
jgi:hypothetical protein